MNATLIKVEGELEFFEVGIHEMDEVTIGGEEITALIVNAIEKPEG